MSIQLEERRKGGGGGGGGKAEPVKYLRRESQSTCRAPLWAHLADQLSHTQRIVMNFWLEVRLPHASRACLRRISPSGRFLSYKSEWTTFAC